MLIRKTFFTEQVVCGNAKWCQWKIIKMKSWRRLDPDWPEINSKTLINVQDS